MDFSLKNTYFQIACLNGHLNIVEFLWNLNQNIDVHANNEYAFVWACENGHLNVVEFLWNLNQNIHIHSNNEYAFRWACAKGHLNIIEFLFSIDSQYFSEYIISENFYIIAEKINNSTNFDVYFHIENNIVKNYEFNSIILK